MEDSSVRTIWRSTWPLEPRRVLLVGVRRRYGVAGGAAVRPGREDPPQKNVPLTGCRGIQFAFHRQSASASS